MTPAQSSSGQWLELWQDNPALREGPSTPIGWVLERSDDIVGYLGNIPLHYHYRSERLFAAAASGFAVNVEDRRHSLRLAAAFFSQKNVDLLLNTTANTSVGSVFQMCKAEKIPQPEFDKALFWVVDARGFAGSVLRSRGHGSTVVGAGSALLAPALRVEAWLRRRGPLGGESSFEVTVLEPDDIDEEFDAFWQRTLAERSHCLLADRSSGVLRWHFNHRRNAGQRAKFVCARRSGRLAGYIALTREDSADIGLKRSRVADLIAEQDDPEVIDALLHAALRQARGDGSHILELVGFPSRIRARLAAGRALRRSLPAWQFWYKAGSKELQERFRDEDVWYGSSYDGDASL